MVKTPADGPLNEAELQAYLSFLDNFTKTAGDTRRAFGEMIQDARIENERIDGWMSRGQRSKVAYLLSLIDDTEYDPRDPDDRKFLQELADQRDIDTKVRRKGTVS
ncbi:hypothetical protein DIPPA_12749 [Diplonema papillatum]|nr:hypothetical protein DIPPA_12749 [Diplonema papillatum]